jgi:hypothetical protein
LNVYCSRIAQDTILKQSTKTNTMVPPTEAINIGLQRLEEAKKLYVAGEANGTEAILDAAQAILAAGRSDQSKPSTISNLGHEKPSDFLQRVMWAEVSNILIYIHIRNIDGSRVTVASSSPIEGVVRRPGRDYMF